GLQANGVDLPVFVLVLGDLHRGARSLGFLFPGGLGGLDRGERGQELAELLALLSAQWLRPPVRQLERTGAVVSARGALHDVATAGRFPGLQLLRKQAGHSGWIRREVEAPPRPRCPRPERLPSTGPCPDR